MFETLKLILFLVESVLTQDRANRSTDRRTGRHGARHVYHGQFRMHPHEAIHLLFPLFDGHSVRILAQDMLRLRALHGGARLTSRDVRRNSSKRNAPGKEHMLEEIRQLAVGKSFVYFGTKIAEVFIHENP